MRWELERNAVYELRFVAIDVGSWETGFGAVCFSPGFHGLFSPLAFLVLFFHRRNVDGNSDTLDSLTSLFDMMHYSLCFFILANSDSINLYLSFSSVAIHRRVNKGRVTTPPFWVAQYARLTWLQEIGCMHGDARLI
jgi:hypothetical protein